eukprot:251444_1
MTSSNPTNIGRELCDWWDERLERSGGSGHELDFLTVQNSEHPSIVAPFIPPQQRPIPPVTMNSMPAHPQIRPTGTPPQGRSQSPRSHAPSAPVGQPQSKRARIEQPRASGHISDERFMSANPHPSIMAPFIPPQQRLIPQVTMNTISASPQIRPTGTVTSAPPQIRHTETVMSAPPQMSAPPHTRPTATVTSAPPQIR